MYTVRPRVGVERLSEPVVSLSFVSRCWRPFFIGQLPVIRRIPGLRGFAGSGGCSLPLLTVLAGARQEPL